MTRRSTTDREDRLLTFEELADILGCSAGHLRNLKYRGRAPVAVKLGRSVRFRLSDVRAWIDEQIEMSGNSGTESSDDSDLEGR